MDRKTSKPSEIERLLTTEEAAGLLGIRPWTLRQWTCERRVPFVKFKKLVRFRPEDLRRWVAEQVVEPNGRE